MIVGFAIGEQGWNPENGPYPVITLFTWLTNLGAFGLVLLLVLVSVAVIGFFRRDQRGVGTGSRLVAPIIAFVALAIVWVLILLNWDVLLGQASPPRRPSSFPLCCSCPRRWPSCGRCGCAGRGRRSIARSGHGTELPEAPILGEPEPVVDATRGNL